MPREKAGRGEQRQRGERERNDPARDVLSGVIVTDHGMSPLQLRLFVSVGEACVVALVVVFASVATAQRPATEPVLALAGLFTDQTTC